MATLNLDSKVLLTQAPAGALVKITLSVTGPGFTGVYVDARIAGNKPWINLVDDADDFARRSVVNGYSISDGSVRPYNMPSGTSMTFYLNASGYSDIQVYATGAATCSATASVEGGAGGGGDAQLRADLAGPNGAALIGWGLRSLPEKLGEAVSVKDAPYNAKGDGVTDDRLAIQAAINANTRLLIPPGVYRLGAALTVPSNRTIVGPGAELKLLPGANSHVIRVVNNAANVDLRDFSVDGNKAENTGGNGIATGLGSSSIRFRGLHAGNCSQHGLYFGGVGTVNVVATHCSATGNGAGGITCNDDVSIFQLNDNRAWSNGTHGIGLLGPNKNGSMNGNLAWNNGQGSETADNITGYNSGVDNVSVIGNTTWGGGNNGIHMGGSRLTIIGNTTYGAAKYGLAVLGHGNPAGQSHDCTITGNVSYNNGISGFWFWNVVNSSITGNTARTNQGHGFAMDGLLYSTFSGNSARQNTYCGFKNQEASFGNTYTGNTAAHNLTDGFDITNVSDGTFVGNNVTSNTGWGFNRAGTEANNTITSNKVRANTAGQIAAMGITTRVSDNLVGLSVIIPAAANLVLPVEGSYFYVSGGHFLIGAIAPSWVGRQVTFQFNNPVTVVDINSLRLAGDFEADYMDTLTIVCDGTNWVEVARSKYKGAQDLPMKTFTINTLPAPDTMPATLVYVADGVGGKRVAVSDNNYWLYPDGNFVVP